MDEQSKMILGIIEGNQARELKLENRFMKLLAKNIKYRNPFIQFLDQADIIISFPGNTIWDMDEFQLSTDEVIDLLNRITNKYFDFE